MPRRRPPSSLALSNWRGGLPCTHEPPFKSDMSLDQGSHTRGTIILLFPDLAIRQDYNCPPLMRPINKDHRRPPTKRLLLSRRHALIGTSAIAGSAAMQGLFIALARAKAPLSNQQAPYFYRFQSPQVTGDPLSRWAASARIRQTRCLSRLRSL